MSVSLRNTVRFGTVLACVLACIVGFTTSAGARPPTFSNAGPKSGIVPPKASGHAKGGSPNLSFHGGPVMTSGAAVTAIFWGTSWTNPSFVSDKFTGIDSFYDGIAGTSYAGTNTEYTDTTGGHVSTAVSYSGHLVDTSAAPSRAPQTSAILAEVARMIPNPVSNGYYPVYVDTPRRNAGYCAWHSTGVANGVTVQFGFFFNLNGDPGCDPQDTSGLHSQGTAALGNVSGHELSETVTDQHLNAWYDSSGSENADKCAWTFGSQLLKLGKTSWKIQGNWSNAAYNANHGYVFGGSVVRGCIDGTN
ncbi:MAG TPA: hypothetical protein VKB75_03410 [Jatrophihabitans sp.]|nr:hypothetical protein [Jatrophihabitans sp.]